MNTVKKPRMKTNRFRSNAAFICVSLWLHCCWIAPPEAQGPGAGQGLAETLEAIERARVVTRVLYVTAHPDDEPGPVLAWLARGAHADVALLSLTRGEGGQNALGPEQAPQLGLLRTAELLSAARHYGVRVYFAGAADFGYCKSAEEALAVWGQPVLGNVVRFIRTFRPHIIINNWGGVRSGHGQHQAAGILTTQAFEAAANPKKFPDQLKTGMLVWRASHLLQFARGVISGAGTASSAADAESLQLPTNEISPLWGRTYTEMGIEGYTQHRTQGVEGVRQSAFIRRLRQFQVVQGAPPKMADFSRTLRELATLSERDTEVLKDVDQILVQALQAAQGVRWTEAVEKLARAGQRIREHPFEDDDQGSLGVELWQCSSRIDAALALAAGVRIEAVADRAEIAPGSSFTVRAEMLSRSSVPVNWDAPRLEPATGWRMPKEEKLADGSFRFAVTVPADAQPKNRFAFGVEPWQAPLVQARMPGTVDNYPFEVTAPVTAQRATTTRLDTLPLVLVPAVTLTPEPRQFVIAEKSPPKQLEIRARVHHYGDGPAEVTAGVDTPAGWMAPPAVKLSFPGPGDQLVRFQVTPPRRVAGGKYPLQPWASLDGRRYETSLEPLPTLPTRLWSEPATVTVHVFDVSMPPELRIGYIAAENDPIPDALRKIAVQVELLDEAALAFGELKQFDAIVAGIRAYELRGDLARANQRLLDYAAAGGTLVVQYQRGNVWNTLKPAPYPASVAERGPGAANPPAPSAGVLMPVREARVTDENSPVRVLRPDHPALSTPNKIGPQDFRDWVQERGLYFWGQFDTRYQPLLAMNDPGEEETTGALVYARLGQGHYIFTGLSFFRQLPEGNPGAYRLMINLLSQSRVKQ